MQCDLPGCRRNASHLLTMNVSGILVLHIRMCTTHKDIAISNFRVEKFNDDNNDVAQAWSQVTRERGRA